MLFAAHPGCAPPTTWCLPPAKYLCCITNALSNLKAYVLSSTPPSVGVEADVLQMPSRGPSNLTHVVISCSCVVDANQESQAQGSVRKKIETYTPPTNPMKIWLKAAQYRDKCCYLVFLQHHLLVQLLLVAHLADTWPHSSCSHGPQFCSWEQSLKALYLNPLYSAVLTGTQQRPGNYCADAAEHPADRNQLRLSLHFPTFSYHPLPLLSHCKRSLSTDHCLFGSHSILPSGRVSSIDFSTR